MTFVCRLAFTISHALFSDRNEISISVGNHIVLIRSSNEIPLKESYKLAAISRDHRTVDDATKFGMHLKQYLLLAAIEGQFGVDVGKERSRGGPGPGLRDWFKTTHGVEVRGDVHGIQVYPDDDSTLILGGSARPSLVVSVERFLELFGHATLRSAVLPPRIRTAAELLSAAYFGESSFACLFLAIAAVEAVAPSGTWSSDQIAVIESAIDAIVEFDAQDTDKEDLIKYLQSRLRGPLSIRQACRLVISNSLGVTVAKEFDDLYDLRSRLIHGNTASDAWDLWQPAFRARALASDLLLRLV